MANSLRDLHNEDKFLLICGNGIFRMAHSVQGVSPHWDGQPLETHQVLAWVTQSVGCGHWALVRPGDGVVKRRLLTVIANGASPWEAG